MFAGAVRVHERALEAPAHQVDLGTWSVVQRPDWMRLTDVEALRDASGLVGRTAPLLDRRHTPALRTALASAPGVARVVALRRHRTPNRFVAVLEVRRPVLAVRLSGEPARYVEVDEAGAVLGAPVTTPPERDGRRLRVVVGAAADADASGGLGADVQAAARLVRDLEQAEAAGGGAVVLGAVTEIDVSNFGGRRSTAESAVVLRLGDGANGGCSVEWGRTSGTAEPPAHAKIAHLRRALEVTPGLQGLRTVKLGFEDLVLVPVRAHPED